VGWVPGCSTMIGEVRGMVEIEQPEPDKVRCVTGTRETEFDDERNGSGERV
jgi:hypothetical protein